MAISTLWIRIVISLFQECGAGSGARAALSLSSPSALYLLHPPRTLCSLAERPHGFGWCRKPASPLQKELVRIRYEAEKILRSSQVNHVCARVWFVVSVQCRTNFKFRVADGAGMGCRNRSTSSGGCQTSWSPSTIGALRHALSP